MGLLRWLVAAVVTSVCSSRSIDVSMRAPWPTTALSPLFEAAEFLAGESAGAFWGFVESTMDDEATRGKLNAAASQAYSSESHEEVGAIALDIASSVLTPLSHGLLGLSLATREYAPRVEAHRVVATSAAVCEGGSSQGTRALVHDGAESRLVCSVEDLEDALASCSASKTVENSFVGLETWYPTTAATKAPAVELIATLGSVEFETWHTELARLATAGKARYTLRHAAYAPFGLETQLQGFGVKLDIKNMEYKNFDTDVKATLKEEEEAVSFDEGAEVAGVVFSTLAKRKPELKPELKKLREALLEESVDASSLKMWRLRDLGLQATASILAAQDPLRKLTELAQDFPSHASSLSSLAVPEDLRRAATLADRRSMSPHMMMMQQPQKKSVIYLGSEAHDVDSPTFSIHELLASLRAQASSLAQLDKLRANGYLTATRRLAQFADEDEEVDEDAPSQKRVDLLSGSKHAVVFVNNLEKDPMYRRWSKSVESLLYPSYQLQAIAKNLYTCVATLDASTDAGLGALRIASLMLEQGYPVRLGLILGDSKTFEQSTDETADLDVEEYLKLKPASTLLGEEVEEQAEEEMEEEAIVAAYVAAALKKKDPSKAMSGSHAAALFASAHAARGPKTAFSMLASLATNYAETAVPLTLGTAVAAYGEAVYSGDEALSEGFAGKSSKKAQADGWRVILGDATFDGTRAAAAYARDADGFLKAKGLRYGYFGLNGLVVDSLDLQGELLPRLGEEQRHLQQLVSQGAISDRTKSIYGKTLLGGAKNREEAVNLLAKHTPVKQDEDDNGDYIAAGENLEWISGSSEDSLVSLVVVADLGTARGINCLALALSSKQAARVAILSSSASSLEGARRLKEIRSATSTELALAALRRDLANPETTTTTDTEFSQTTLDELSEGEQVILVNGRKLSSRPGQPLLTAADLTALLESETALAEEVSLIVDSRDVESVMRCAVFVGKRRSQNGPRTDVDATVRSILGLGSDTPLSDSALVVVDKEAETLSITAVLDPLTEAAARAAPVLLTLRDALGLSVRLVLLPTPDLSTVPLQKYYRMALHPSSIGSLASIPRARFDSLPKGHVLTVGLETPESWDVQTAIAPSDLDNLRCEDDDCNGATGIVYALKSLTVTGQCYDAREKRPPNGLQLELQQANAKVSDTLVMQNLGYFQLRAAPGAFLLGLANGTKSSELYEVIADEQTKKKRASLDADGKATKGQRILVADFSGASTFLRVRKKPEFAHVDLLDSLDSASEDAEVSTGGVMSRLWRTTSPAASPQQDDNETIHVFSLATGELYERMLKIMMLSVRKRTTGPVKFWLFENYLTPSFKLDAERLALKKGFEVAYVTYKWPEWLRRQTEKQRIIWGYKILFLDVLFPLSVPKIIYVDADQIVRGDLRELWHEDLQNKPYGYVPFCDSRPETLGYQFWRSGYWKDHLGSKPYHISALYVVDLHAFRRMGVGDQLRAVYDQLSRDPNSLANLDQDLPNYAQVMIPIHSLPQEWLWCESWCSDETKAQAKTIDLCNNPEHKENKLSMAKRIIQGPLFEESWVELDDEVKQAVATP